jgi:two-component system chemotaxis sensor kinase CheA
VGDSPAEAEVSPDVDILRQDILDELLQAQVPDPAEQEFVANILGSPAKQEDHTAKATSQPVQHSPQKPRTEPSPAPATRGVAAVDRGDIQPTYRIEGDIEILQEFATEVEEHINAIEMVILGAEGNYAKDSIDTLFRGVHSIKGGSAYFNLQEMTKCSHLLEDILHEVRDGHRQMSSRLEQLLLLYLDNQKEVLERCRTAAANDGTMTRSDGSLILLEYIRGFDSGVEINRHGESESPPAETEPAVAVAPSPLPPASEHQAKPADVHAPSVKVDQPHPEASISPPVARPAAVAEPEPMQPKSDKLAKKVANEATEAARKFVKVDTDRLDNLIDLIGEMVVFSSVLVRFCKLHMSEHKDVMDAAHRVEKFSKELQDVGISMRLDPIRALFQKMQRLVWDTSKRLGKDVSFEMEGEDTELDRNLIDRLADPLMHMVRNSLDHGVEMSADRVAAGKSKKGRIKLSAYHSGGNVHIKIEDDGRGLNPDKLIAKAIEKGIIDESRRLSEQEAFQLIFAPGFSTAAQITDISGRGVGMDVVRRNVEDLRGRIHIESKVGQGAAFIIELPLTLAIIDGIMIKVGIESFILPSLAIVEFIRPKRNMISCAMDSAETFHFRGSYLPLYRLSELYGIEGAVSDPERGTVVVVEDNNEQVAFLADQIEGECSTVIKSLGGMFEDVKGISGGAIMPQGDVVLILDVKSLTRLERDSYEHRARVASVDGASLVLH